MSDAAERYARVSEVLACARDLAGAELEAHLARECGDDAALRAEVEELLALASEDEAGALREEELAGARRALEGLLDDASPAWLPEEIGGYRILGQLGQGGMGVVYEAEQASPRRRVAIKLLHPMHATPERLRRFRREAALLGRLRHPGIAQIFEAGTYDIGRGPQPFFAMERIDGLDLRTHCQRHELDARARLELLARVADAVHYAHERGVVHRDLKPDNVLVDARGDPRVLDFGIARHSGASGTLSTLVTDEGQLVGTLAYMAPEQLRHSPDAITAQVDVYALGVLGFELLLGRLPHEIDDVPVSQAIALLADTEAPRAGQLDPRLRGDVETILGKALEPEPARRYASAQALAADLRRHLDDLPIEARPPSRLYHARKFARRHKALVGGVLATLLVSIAGALVATHYARVALQRADAQERASYAAGLAAAVRALEQEDYAATGHWLDRLPARLRGWEHDYLRARLVHYSEAWEAPEPVASRPVFEPGRERVHAFLADGSIATWEASSGRLIGRRTVAGLRAGVEETMGGLSVHPATLRYAALAADGGVLVGTLAGGEPTRLAPLAPGGCNLLLAWDPDGQRLLYRGEETFLWDGERSQRFTDATAFCADFNPAGDRVAVADRDLVRVYDVATAEELARTRLPDTARAVRFAPDGETLAYAGEYRNVLLLDPGDLQVVRRLTGHAGRLDGLSWSAGGELLLSASSADETARIWDAGRGWEARAFSLAGRPDAPARRQSFTSIAPDGSYFLAANEGLARYPLAEPGVLRGHDTYVYRLEFSPDGSRLASAGFYSAEVHLWDVHGASLLARLAGPAPGGAGSLSPALELGFSADGRLLVALAAQESRQWDARTGAALPPPEPGESPSETFMAALGRRAWGPDRRCALSADGSLVAVRTGPSRVELHELEPGTARAAAEALEPAEFLARVCYPYHQGAQPAGVLESPGGEVYCVAIHPDGTRIATGGNDAAIRIWDRERCELLLVLRGHQQYVMDLAFSPDGSLLASASGDTTVRLWDTRPLYERRAPGRVEAAGRR